MSDTAQLVTQEEHIMSLQAIRAVFQQMQRIVVVVLGCVSFLVTPTLLAAGYPDHPVRWVVPSTSGGGTDKVTRVIAIKLAQYLGQNIVIENHPGASGNIGAQFVSRASPDGYTLLTVIGSHTSNAAVMKKVPFDLVRDFAPVTLMLTAPSMMIGHPSLPPKTVRELIPFAKARPMQLEFASGGVGSIQHMAMALFLNMTGTKMLHVPYKATYPALLDVMAGRVPLMVIGSMSALPQVRAGKLRAYGVTSLKRMTVAPDIPPIAEQGLPNYEAIQWFGLLAPAGTPREITSKLYAGVRHVLQDPKVQTLFINDGVETAPSASPDAFGTMIRSELAKWAKVAKGAGIKPE